MASGGGFQKSQRRRIGVAAGLESQLKMIIWIVAGGVHSKTARRPVFKTLVYGQNHQFARSCQAAAVQQTRDIGFSSRGIAFIPAQDFPNALRHPAALILPSHTGKGFRGCHTLPPTWMNL